jgi:hypothetical protein
LSSGVPLPSKERVAISETAMPCQALFDNT